MDYESVWFTSENVLEIVYRASTNRQFIRTNSTRMQTKTIIYQIEAKSVRIVNMHGALLKKCWKLDIVLQQPHNSAKPPHIQGVLVSMLTGDIVL